MSLLLLLLIANGMPVIAHMILRDKFATPVDGGRCFVDGKRLFGARKTVRGLLSACLVTSLAALLLGFSWHVGVLVAVGAMAGDLLSSFIKRRFAVAPHRSVLGLDQIPEALLPLMLVKTDFVLDGCSMVVIVLAFCVIEWCLSKLIDCFNLLGINKD